MMPFRKFEEAALASGAVGAAGLFGLVMESMGKMLGNDSLAPFYRSGVVVRALHRVASMAINHVCGNAESMGPRVELRGGMA